MQIYGAVRPGLKFQDLDGSWGNTAREDLKHCERRCSGTHSDAVFMTNYSCRYCSMRVSFSFLSVTYFTSNYFFSLVLPFLLSFSSIIFSVLFFFFLIKMVLTGKYINSFERFKQGRRENLPDLRYFRTWIQNIALIDRSSLTHVYLQVLCTHFSTFWQKLCPLMRK